MSFIRVEYEYITLKRAQLANRIEDIPDSVIEKLAENCKMLLEDYIYKILENFSQNKGKIFALVFKINFHRTTNNLLKAQSMPQLIRENYIIPKKERR